MQNINELKDAIGTTTVNFILLSIATAGIYPILWLYRCNPIIEKITNKKLTDSTFVIWLAVCVGLGRSLIGSGEEALDIIAGILTIASGVLYMVWAFKAKSAIEEFVLTEHKIDLRMNGFYTLLFTIYYINYCINDLSESKRRQEILTGKSQHLQQ